MHPIRYARRCGLPAALRTLPEGGQRIALFQSGVDDLTEPLSGLFPIHNSTSFSNQARAAYGNHDAGVVPDFRGRIYAQSIARLAKSK
jgi:hypothetical protein